MRNRVLFLCFAALLSVSCADEDSFITDPNSFQGSWSIKFSGDYIGNGHLVIDANGVFFNSMTLENGNGFLDLSGTVTHEGVIEARLLRGSAQIGTMKGNMNGNSGSGTWQTNDGKAGGFEMTRL